MDRYVWVPEGEGPSWMAGGTYLVARRIRMLIEVWDRVSLGEQEGSIGRHKYSGAPIGKEDEFDPVDLEARDDDGELLIARGRPRAGSPDRATRRRSCAAATPLPTASTPSAANSTPACSLSPSSATRTSSSCPCSNDSPPTTASTSTSATPRAPCSPARPASREGGYVGEGLFEQV